MESQIKRKRGRPRKNPLPISDQAPILSPIPVQPDTKDNISNINNDTILDINPEIFKFDICYRPDIYFDNKKYCNGCTYYNLCGCKLKKLNPTLK